VTGQVIRIHPKHRLEGTGALLIVAGQVVAHAYVKPEQPVTWIVVSHWQQELQRDG